MKPLLILALLTLVSLPASAQAPFLFEFDVPIVSGNLRGVAADVLGNSYCIDATTVFVFNDSGSLATSFSHGHSGAVDIEVASSGLIYTSGVSESVSHIRVQSSTGSLLNEWATTSEGQIAVDSERGYVFIATNFLIEKYSDDGTYLFSWGTFSNSKIPGTFNGISDLCVDDLGRVFVVDSGNDRVQVFSTEGYFLYQFGSSGFGDGQLFQPRGIAVDNQSTVFIADLSAFRVQAHDSQGGYLYNWGNYGTGPGLFVSPYHIDVDANGRIYVGELANGRVQVFAASNSPVSVRNTTWGRIKTQF